MGKRNLNRLIHLFFRFLIIVGLVACSAFGGELEEETDDRPLCQALDVSTSTQFEEDGNTAFFDQLFNNQAVFLFLSSLIAEAYDGQNVIELFFARVEFDFEDGSVDPGDFGGFHARWKIILVPFDQSLLDAFLAAQDQVGLDLLIDKFRAKNDRVESQLPGPFLENGCEWGDTDEIGTQTLNYQNYGIWDWDFYPSVNRVLGVVYEGDDGVHDDFIEFLDISKFGGVVTREVSGLFRLQFDSNVDVLTSQ